MVYSCICAGRAMQDSKNMKKLDSYIISRLFYVSCTTCERCVVHQHCKLFIAENVREYCRKDSR